MNCNCKRKPRFVRGNAFSLNVKVEAKRPDGTSVSDFVLDDTATLLLMTSNGVATVLTYTVGEDNNAIVAFDGNLPVGIYGLDFQGSQDGTEWRFSDTNIFQVVEHTPQGNVPSDGVVYADDTLEVDAEITLSTLSAQADWTETDPGAQSYIRNKPDLSTYATDAELTAGLAEKQDKLYNGNVVSIETVNRNATPVLKNIVGNEVSAIVPSTDPYSGWNQGKDTDIPTVGLVKAKIEEVNTALANKQNRLTFDTTPTEYSANPVTSGGIKTALDAKQDTMTFDTTPTANSTNPVTSGGIKTALDGKQATIDDLSAIRSGASAGATAVQPATLAQDIAALPDNEDIDYNSSDKLQFANKAYNAATFSGLGRVYLRKNIVEVSGTDKNVLTQAMVNTANTIYHIQYDYDLNGQTITLPAGCVLEFDGGSLVNGTLVGNNTQLRGIGKDCLLCDFGGSFSDIDIDVEVFGLHPSTASVNQQDTFDRLSNFIGAVETINVSFPIGIYAYGGGSNTPQGTSAPRAYYNYYGIFLKSTYRTKNLSIYGNGSTFIPAIPFYVGAWNYVDGELTPNYATDNISVWTKGGGFFRTQCDMNSLCFYDCVVDGDLEYNNYGGAQTATQEQFGVGMESASLQNFIAKGCIFKNNVTDGIALGAVPYVNIKDCQFIKNMRWGISMSAAGVIEISNCDFSDNGKIFSVNNYYKFEGNWGDIDFETGSDAPSREITILNCRFKGTGGASSVVANRNVKSFVIDGCSFAYDTTQMAYSGTSIIYKDSFTMPIYVRFINGECSVRNIEAINARMYFALCGVNPSSSDIPSDETNLFFRGDSHKYRAQHKNIILRYTDNCIGFDTTSALPYAGLVTNQSVNFLYNGTRWDVTDVSNEESHYGDADVENIQVHLISHVCIGEYNATAERTNTAFSNMVVFVNNSSNKNYFKRFKNNITGSIILNDLHVFDNANNDTRTIYVENLKRRVEDNGNIIYHGSASVPSIRFADDADCFRTAGAAGGMVAGTTAKTPSVGMSLGVPYFDITKGRPVFWNGSAYVDALGGLNSLRAISISQADYDALQTKDPNTLYVIV